MVLFGVSLIWGCTPQKDPAAPRVRDNDERAVTPPVSAFELDQAKQVITLNTRVAPRQRRRFDIGLGSITLETIRVANNELTFLYTPEVEGVYSVYECTVPVSPTAFEIKITPNGTPGATSFDLTKCKVIRHGNVLFE